MPKQSDNDDDKNNSDYDFELSLAVRDYECDLQGVVNNATYQNYLEHARHKYLQNSKIKDFACFSRAFHILEMA